MNKLLYLIPTCLVAITTNLLATETKSLENQLDYQSAQLVNNDPSAESQKYATSSLLNLNVNGVIQAAANQRDGKILIGGNFTKVNDENHNALVRLHADGSVDSSFKGYVGALDVPCNMINTPVKCIAIQRDGKILIGGDFKTVNGEEKSNLARLNSDGSLDKTFNAYADGIINVIELDNGINQSIFIGGAFNAINDQNKSRLAKLNFNGSLDESFNSPDFDNDVFALKIYPSNGEIAVGGSFEYVDDNNLPHLVWLSKEGHVEEKINLFFNGVVYTIAMQSDEKIVVGGEFIHTSFNRNEVFTTSPALLIPPQDSAVPSYVVRLNNDGSVDQNFGLSTNGPIHCITALSDDSLLLGGSFTTVNGQSKAYTAKSDSNGKVDPLFDPDLNGKATLVVVLKDGRYLISGDFSQVNGQNRSYVAHLTVPVLNAILIENRFADYSDYNYRLYWDEIPLLNRTGYSVYRDGEWLIDLNPTTLEYIDRRIKSNHPYTYSVHAYSDGDQSPSVVRMVP
jgi:uncharacterized delta-60 repeat protein